jgi:uncharacterized phiE125 gp8 family phage protein
VGLLLVTPPAVEPVSLAEAKAQCRIDPDFTLDDAYVSGLVTAAREAAEVQCERSFIATTWRYFLDCFPCVIRLPRPAIAVQSVQYLSQVDGSVLTLDPAEYQVSQADDPTTIRPAYRKYWPQTRWVAEAVRVNFTAGYGATTASVPEGIKQAIKIIVEHWYEHRGEDPSMRDIPAAAENLLRRYWHGNYS